VAGCERFRVRKIMCSGSRDRPSARRSRRRRGRTLPAHPPIPRTARRGSRQGDRLGCDARALRELRTHFNADDGGAALEQEPGCLASRATNLQEPVTGLELGQLDEVIEKLSRIRRPRRLVEVCCRVEGFGAAARASRSRVNRLENAMSCDTRSAIVRRVSAHPALLSMMALASGPLGVL
jgi:hypothetical protein